MLITIIQNINGQAQRKVDREILQEIKKVRGKNNILVSLLETLLENRDNVIEDVVFSVVGEDTLRDLLKELTHYLKSVFRHLRAELEVNVPKASKRLPYVPTEDEIKHYYEAVWKAKNFQDMIIIKTLLYTVFV
jgi:hypothetical protein